MIIVSSALIVAFGAMCVWLAVRVFNRSERWAKWTLAIAIGLPTLNVLSFGPACWWLSRERGLGSFGEAARWISAAYVPCGRLATFGPPIISDSLIWYASLGADPLQGRVIPVAWRHWSVEKL